MAQDDRQPPPAEELAPLAYDELWRIAGAYMRRERSGQTLQATALVHEAYLRPAGAGAPWTDKCHFVGIAARSMRQILVERAHATWGRTHQLAIVLLLAGSAALRWQIKERIETPLTVAIFLALGAAATIGGVLRGHLLFTEWVNRASLGRERRRNADAIRLFDLVAAALLFADDALIAVVRALPAVFALSAALGLALAALVLEPATTAAAFGDEPNEP